MVRKTGQIKNVLHSIEEFLIVEKVFSPENMNIHISKNKQKEKKFVDLLGI